MSYPADPYNSTRNEFKQAFQDYTEAGSKMHQALSTLVDEPTENRAPIVQQYQSKVDEARHRYQLARERYVEEVLDGLSIHDPATGNRETTRYAGCSYLC